ncbi:MAG: Rrf2 family transcriptional regulator [Acidobacteria bacterium]|nr:Rrf2 family transcriptional regulator [Acidobacteriota bacterium]
MLTRKSKYGIKAVLALAERQGGQPVLIADVAAKHRIPMKFLQAILLDLKRHGILQSKKGKGGGYFLRRDPHDITVGEVIRVLDGPLALVPCVSQTAYHRCEECVDEATCRVRWIMREVRDATAGILDRTSLAELNARGRATPRRRTAARGRAGNSLLTR